MGSSAKRFTMGSKEQYVLNARKRLLVKNIGDGFV